MEDLVAWVCSVPQSLASPHCFSFNKSDSIFEITSMWNDLANVEGFSHCWLVEAKTPLSPSWPELQSAVEEVLPTLKEQDIHVFIMSERCDVEGIESLSDKIQQASDEPLSHQLRANIHLKSPALYIYTSGTTGELTFTSGVPSCVQTLSKALRTIKHSTNSVVALSVRASQGGYNQPTKIVDGNFSPIHCWRALR